MNLARVEHYFSRFLSSMEIRSREGAAQLDLAPGHHVELTPNLRFTGTVNVDETTHGFADKVFDRAQVIELPLGREDVIAHMNSQPYAGLLMDVWDSLRPVAPFGFRVLDEVDAYVTAASELGTPWQKALDEQLVQKVLPRIRSDVSAGDGDRRLPRRLAGRRLPPGDRQGLQDEGGPGSPWLPRVLLISSASGARSRATPRPPVSRPSSRSCRRATARRSAARSAGRARSWSATPNPDS